MDLSDYVPYSIRQYNKLGGAMAQIKKGQIGKKIVESICQK
jgi:hypothetical protein